MGSSVCNKLPLIKTRLFKQKLVFFRSLKTTEDMDHCTILNIPLDNPEELDLKHKPAAIREDKIFTLDQRVIPIASAEADDNGAYISKGNAKRYFQYSSTSGSRTVHLENGVFFANRKAAKGYKRIMICRRRFMNLTDITKRTKPTCHFQGLLSQLKQSMNENQSLGIWSCISGQVELKSLSCSAMVMP